MTLLHLVTYMYECNESFRVYDTRGFDHYRRTLPYFLSKTFLQPNVERPTSYSPLERFATHIYRSLNQ